MKLHMHPASPPSGAILLFIAESGMQMDTQVIDLMTGEHQQPEYLAVNPNGLVPASVDDDLRLKESAVVLKYLAEGAGSPLYPGDPKERARVNEAMDWLNANLYRDLGFNHVYPQIFEHHHRRSTEGTGAAVARGQARVAQWLTILDRWLIGDVARHLCLGRLTIADLYGAALLTLGDAVQLDLSPYPNVQRWLGEVKALPSWPEVNEPFYSMVAAMQSQAA